VEECLGAERDLTAVDRFSRQHDQPGRPALESQYRALLPLSAPRPGEQYAFEVDLDRCSGCKGCVTACHALNGLDEDESWRSVGLLTGLGRKSQESPVTLAPPGFRFQPPLPPAAGPRAVPLQQTVTTACHHCVEPACLHGCPVLAYDKDPLTGIVRHLDDQCIGCSYCVMMCPYEVPRFSARRGIVRKCDLCHGRLADGEAPACVQACPNEAIRVTLVETRDVRARQDAAAPDSPWLPDAPSPSRTLPTTRYVTQQPNRELLAADHAFVRPAPAHLPLVFMLVFTQIGMGGLVATLIHAVWGVGGPTTPRLPLISAVAAGLLFLGLGASVLHLGQPAKAWKVWMGWRRSWLSREALLLNAVAGVTLPGVGPIWIGRDPLGFVAILFPLVTLAAVGAQVMVYADTGRRFWRVASTAPRFLGTMMLGGIGTALWVQAHPFFTFAFPLLVVAKGLVEGAVLIQPGPSTPPWSELQRTALLLKGPLLWTLVLRVALGLLAAGLIFQSLPNGLPAPAVTLAALAALIGGELLERFLFFTAVAPDRMPGLPR
jgi:Fe-S-cluster-containing dehydrogenase component/DMSO reductase anchor subunit